MSAYDADDLYERAEQALARDVPTVAEVEARLAAAIEVLEREFPNGRPRRTTPGLSAATARLRYRTLISDVQHCRSQLENGRCVELAMGGRVEHDPEWEAFLEGHPELDDVDGDA